MAPIIVLGAMSTYDWLLFLHITGAFLLGGGVIVAGAFNLTAQFRRKPSEIALLFGLTRWAVVAIIVGGLLTLTFGLALVSEAPWGYRYTQGWVIAAIVLWFVGMGMGESGGRRDRKAHELAERLAASGDEPSAELQARIRNPISLVLSYGSAVVIVAMLVIMVWKPGA
jgi:uncharacterized membrane protein